MDMPKTKVREHRGRLKGFDAQSAEFSQLDAKQQQALKLLNEGKTYDQIRVKVYPDMTRQATWDVIRRAERKVWRLSAKKRWAHNPRACPIDELPLPARIRNSLTSAGYLRIGQLAGKSLADLANIKGPVKPGKPRGLRRISAMELYALLQSWELTDSRPHSYCPKCGSPVGKKFNGKQTTLSCEECGSKISVLNVTEGQPAAAHA